MQNNQENLKLWRNVVILENLEFVPDFVSFSRIFTILSGSFGKNVCWIIVFAAPYERDELYRKMPGIVQEEQW